MSFASQFCLPIRKSRVSWTTLWRASFIQYIELRTCSSVNSPYGSRRLDTIRTAIVKLCASSSRNEMPSSGVNRSISFFNDISYFCCRRISRTRKPTIPHQAADCQRPFSIHSCNRRHSDQSLSSNIRIRVHGFRSHNNKSYDCKTKDRLGTS